MRSIGKHRMGLLQVAFPTDRAEATRIELQLDEREFGLIGYALVHWALMEHALLEATIAMVADLKISEPANIRQDAFNRRLASFAEVVAQMKDEAEKKRFGALGDRMSTLNGFRQKLAHGIWAYDAADPEVLHVEVSRRDGGPKEYFNSDRIHRFATDVSEVTFQLMYPPDLTIEQLAEARGDGPYVSRAFLRVLFPDRR